MTQTPAADIVEQAVTNGQQNPSDYTQGADLARQIASYVSSSSPERRTVYLAARNILNEQATEIEALRAREIEFLNALDEAHAQYATLERKLDEAVALVQEFRPLLDQAYARAALDSDYEAALASSLNRADQFLSSIRGEG